jgi:hypothetical protein
MLILADKASFNERHMIASGAYLGCHSPMTSCHVADCYNSDDEVNSWWASMWLNLADMAHSCVVMRPQLIDMYQ